jgi:hypothetical protein
MVSLEEVAATARSLPDVVEGERRGAMTWFVGGKAFAWERPFSKADLRRFAEQGLAPPDGPICAVRVRDLDEKDAQLAVERPGFFTIPHFDGYAAVLIQLDVADANDVRQALHAAWAAVESKRR